MLISFTHFASSILSFIFILATAAGVVTDASDDPSPALSRRTWHWRVNENHNNNRIMFVWVIIKLGYTHRECIVLSDGNNPCTMTVIFKTIRCNTIVCSPTITCIGLMVPDVFFPRPWPSCQPIAFIMEWPMLLEDIGLRRFLWKRRWQWRWWCWRRRRWRIQIRNNPTWIK